MNKKYYRNNKHRLQLVVDEDIYIENKRPIKKFRDIGSYEHRIRGRKTKTHRITKILL